MGVLETGIIYGLIGLAVATALVLRSEASSPPARVALFAMGTAFWPLYAPALLAPEKSRGRARAGSPDAATLGERMQAAQARLLEALAQVEGVAQAVAPEVARVRLVTGQVAEMERRVKEIDALLGTEEFDLAAAREALARIAARAIPESDPRHQSVQVRVKNIERLHGIRERTLEDLEKIALKLEEMSSRLKLLRFAGRPDAEVVQLFKEVADSVEDVTEGLMAAAG
jgi:septation ring formation regulator EzrA